MQLINMALKVELPKLQIREKKGTRWASCTFLNNTVSESIIKTTKQWHRHYLREISIAVKNNNIRGSFIECGVKQGTSSVIMAKALERNGILFDTWAGFPGFSSQDITNKSSLKRTKKRCNRPSTKEDCVKNLRENGVFDLCKMVQGDILKTVPVFNKKNISICMMHVDTDIYEPAKVSLDYFWDIVSDGGVVFVHDYKDKKWVGIQKAVDEFVKKVLGRGEKISLHEYPAERLKSCLIVKDDNLNILK